MGAATSGGASGSLASGAGALDSGLDGFRGGRVAFPVDEPAKVDAEDASDCAQGIGPRVLYEARLDMTHERTTQRGQIRKLESASSGQKASSEQSKTDIGRHQGPLRGELGIVLGEPSFYESSSQGRVRSVDTDGMADSPVRARVHPLLATVREALASGRDPSGKSWSARSLSEAAGLSHSYVGNLVKGKLDPAKVGIDKIKGIANALGINESELIISPTEKGTLRATVVDANEIPLVVEEMIKGWNQNRRFDAMKVSPKEAAQKARDWRRYGAAIAFKLGSSTMTFDELMKEIFRRESADQERADGPTIQHIAAIAENIARMTGTDAGRWRAYAAKWWTFRLEATLARNRGVAEIVLDAASDELSGTSSDPDQVPTQERCQEIIRKYEQRVASEALTTTGPK